MKVYIRSSACISPQRTFGSQPFLTNPVEYNCLRLKAIEPDYTAFADTKVLRRMGHVIKMGIAAAMECLSSGNVVMPGAVITGTAYGCIEDTVTFLTRMIELDEQLLPPTAFIQSTHNTVAAQIALLLKCHDYNSTFVHKGISFESALLDAMMLLNEEEADNILVGGIDEMTDTSFTVLERLGLFKRWPSSNLTLIGTPSKGTIGGEGAGFFLLTSNAAIDSMAELKGLHTFYKPVDTNDIEKKITTFLSIHGLNIDEIDLVITGKNGDIRNDEIYNQLSLSLFNSSSLAFYKHLSGEYPTSSAFALWLAANVIKEQTVPDIIQDGKIEQVAPKKILIYNHYLNSYHSLMLVTAN